ncbi:MAG TPA: Gfo/Idh/MocA family oxidoreductase, partial [Gemmataceae bacterium]|nr:Gfo/Idh/MocA family oxidoreductase [Gemmataceae bacterium]
MSNSVDRRDFLKSTAAAGAALGLTAASARRVYGANENVRIGFLGVGGRCQQHIDAILEMQKEGKKVVPVAVCDVWDGDPVLGSGKGRGLYPSAKRCGIKEDKDHVTKDYRRVLDAKDVDIVCIATPDHWHARMVLDAAKAEKDVYCEKPMTRTIPEAQAVVEAINDAKRIMCVGVQSMADPTWQQAYQYIIAGKIGKLLQGQTSYYRNYIGGQWRYYPLKKDMTPKTIDWPMWLGCKFECCGEKLGPTPDKQPFDRAVWAQWRCYWPFGGGMFTDLFVHQTTHLISAMGVRYPRRVVGAGGIFLEYDGRDVPDVATVVADYDEGCQVIISATMCNDTQLGELIRGRLATMRFITGGPDFMKGFEVYGQEIGGGPTKPKEGFSKAVHTFTSEKFRQPEQKKETPVELSATYALWENFLQCVADRNRDKLLSPPELGAAAFTTVAMGVQSYRQGKVLFWNK